MEKTKGNGYKSLLGKFQLNTGVKCFTIRKISHWSNLPKEVVDSPKLGNFKIQLDKGAGSSCLDVLNHKGSLIFFERGLNDREVFLNALLVLVLPRYEDYWANLRDRGTRGGEMMKAVWS